MCPKLKIVKSLGVLLFKGDHSILRLPSLTCIYSSKSRIKIRYIIHTQCHGNHIEMKRRSNILLKLTYDRQQGQIFPLILSTCRGFSLFHNVKTPSANKRWRSFINIRKSFINIRKSFININKFSTFININKSFINIKK